MHEKKETLILQRFLHLLPMPQTGIEPKYISETLEKKGDFEDSTEKCSKGVQRVFNYFPDFS